ncbi:hypothetical protein QCA50_017489 [Cerrena zonata]|uniref:Protein kinase domain-containing protein n=1 Tax=Cerrena zonata TaxID=2478898 RepID=A0AAW0FRU3_9APHY
MAVKPYLLSNLLDVFESDHHCEKFPRHRASTIKLLTHTRHTKRHSYTLMCRLLLMPLRALTIILRTLGRLVLGIPYTKSSEKHTDDSETVRILRHIFDSVKSGDLGAEIYSRHGVDAERVVNLLQDLLDNGKTWKLLEEDPDEFNRPQACLSLLHISKLSHVLPQALFVKADLLSLMPEERGSSSDLYVGMYKGEKVAMRKIRSHPRVVNEGDRDPVREKLLLECLKWRQLHHQNVLPLLGVDPDTVFHAPTLVQPWMSRGNIREYINKLARKPDNDRLVIWLSDIGRGMKYLHDMNICHGDLRGNNILVSDDGVARVTDVVLLSLREEWTGAFPQRKGGPERWMAPELLQSSKPTFATDSFAFGFVTIELFTGEIPDPDLSDTEVVDKIRHGIFPARPNTMSEEVWSLASRCWGHDPSTRPTMGDVVDTLSGTL